MTTSSNSSIAPYLNTTEFFPPDDVQRTIKHTNVYSNIANAVNVREISLYPLEAILTGQQFFSATEPKVGKYAYRKVFIVPAIAAGATLNIAHGITGLVQLTHIYGTCVTDVVDYRPIPYVDAVAITNQVSIKVVGANIVIVNGATAPNITSGIIVLEYLLN